MCEIIKVSADQTPFLLKMKIDHTFPKRILSSAERTEKEKRMFALLENVLFYYLWVSQKPIFLYYQ